MSAEKNHPRSTDSEGDTSSEDMTAPTAVDSTAFDPFDVPADVDGADRLFGEDTGDQADADAVPAEHLTATYAAFRLGVDDIDEIDDYDDRRAVRELRAWWRRHFVDQPTTWAEAPVVPVAPIADVLTEQDGIPTREEVTQDAVDQGDEDPHDVAARLIAERPQRLREKAEAKREKVREEKAEAKDVDPFAGRMTTFGGLASVPPPVPLIDGFLYRGTMAQVAGAPGTGKSFAALAMACAIATGTRWGDHDVPEALPVIYVAAEGSTGLRSRIAAWCEQTGADVAQVEKNLHLFPDTFQLGNMAHMRALAREVREKNAALVVVDTRARCSDGLEENSAKEQGVVVGAVDDIVKATGATIFTIHHTAIGASRGRGSGAWDGALYSDLLLTRPSDKNKVQADGRPVYPITIRITCRKHKDMESGCHHDMFMDRHDVSPDLMPEATDKQRETLVVSLDPFNGPGAERGVPHETIRLYAILRALQVDPDPLPVTSIRSGAGSAAKDVLVSLGMLEPGKRLPSTGVFSRTKIDAAIAALAEEDRLITESITNGKTRYVLTDEGENEAKRLTATLGIDGNAS